MTDRRTKWGAYVGITEVLRQRIIEGGYAHGSRLPSEAALRREFGVARNTLRRSLVKLQDEGLVKVVAGVGRFVCAPGEDLEQTDPQPVYMRIAGDLRSRIQSGEFEVGSALPSESRICERYEVARYTARLAFRELERAGLLEAVHGKGRFVRPGRP
ncbi:GntR family transcriptional regulator [Spirillospora sp. NPDC048911]|uniref:GntR family transcriptional regulator n=1 Tax=Spirillospora sp. NPDC048911 TaxID=3364527 RepID=UPI00371EABF8